MNVPVPREQRKGCISFPQKRPGWPSRGLGGSEWPPTAQSLSPGMPPALQRYRTCLVRGGNKALEPHIDVHLHPQEQRHLQQDQLELPDTWKDRELLRVAPLSPWTAHSQGPQGLVPLKLTDVVQRASAEAPIELLGAQRPQVVDGEGPEVQDVVAGEGVAFLQQHHAGTQQRQLDGRAQPAGASAHHQALPGTG